jgi:hypothetical protein
MKIKFILAVLVFIVLSSSVFVWWRLTNFRDITIDIVKPSVSVKIVGANKNSIATITRSATINLQDGTYFAYPIGGDIDETPIKFTTNKDMTRITIDPSISLGTLRTTLEQEREDIVAAIITKYPNNISQFTIDRGQLLRQGDWYITTLVYKNASNDNPRDTYKVIVQKIDGVWTVIGSPQIIPTKYNFPDVPIDIIENAHKLTKDTL